MTMVIGLVGKKGSGKGTVIGHIRSMLDGSSVKVIRFSDVLFETLALWGIPPTRTHLQDLAVVMKHFGDDALTRAVKSRIDTSDADVVILDGVRWLPDEALVRSYPQHLMIYVDTAAETRFERSRGRGEKAGEADASWEQFMKEEQAPNELLITEIGRRAHVTIDNNGTADDLYRQAVTLHQDHLAALL